LVRIVVDVGLADNDIVNTKVSTVLFSIWPAWWVLVIRLYFLTQLYNLTLQLINPML